MDVYHIWCNLAPGVHDLEFAEDLHRYLDHLRERGAIRGYRVTRAKLGLRPSELREFHIMLDFDDLAQVQAAFDTVASRAEPVEGLHHAVNSKVRDVMFALYRDFPDAVRQTGEERF